MGNPTFGEMLRRLRLWRSLSQRRLAYEACTHYSVISRLENGKQMAGPELVNRLCSVLKPLGYIEQVFRASSTEVDLKPSPSNAAVRRYEWLFKMYSTFDEDQIAEIEEQLETMVRQELRLGDKIDIDADIDW